MSGSNISKQGVSDVGLHKAGKLIDKSDCYKKPIKSGANINKQVPGMNNSIVPLNNSLE
jgi:hypothetical protein